MDAIQQNTLYLTTPGTYVSRDHLTLQVEVPVYPESLPPENRTRETATGQRKVAIPIHHLESICVFGPATISPPALDLCWEHGVAVNFLNEWGRLHARLTGVADTSVTLRRTQFRAADDPAKCIAIARQIIAGKLQNSRNSLLRAARESAIQNDRKELESATDALGRQIRDLPDILDLDALRGAEGMAASLYFAVLALALKQQREAFALKSRSRRPPRDRINCLLSFLYALVRHDCIAALTTAGLDPFVGFLHVDRPNRPSLALDLMEEFRPWLADRLAITLVNRQQIGPDDFSEREGGAVEFTETGRKRVIKAYQERKQETLNHPLLDQNLRIAQLPFVQARVLARTLRGDLADYLPLVPK
ncbi:MAG: type I-C CRISPR-associated endonuclease Cas1 [Verrucomicrobiales bacterium]|nr:type I-C CRISPR-associated endonuclease Cas1 [Verrucomicrobiales bacterium]